MSKNDFAVLVVDVSAENRRFEETREMAAAFVLRKLVHHSTKSQICLILLGTPGTDGNDLEYEGLTVVRSDFERVSQDLYKEIKELTQNTGRNVQYLEALALVFEQITQKGTTVGGNPIWTVEMMTDGSLPQPASNPDDEEFEVGIVGQVLNLKKDITLNIRGLPEGEAGSGQQVLRRIANASAPRAHVFASLTPGPLVKAVGGNATFKMEFDWGGLLKMKVTGFIHAQPGKFPTCSKRVTAKEGDPEDVGQVRSDRDYHLKDDRDVKLSSEDLISAYMYGDQAVTIEESDDLHYTEPEKSMQLLGCFPRGDILPHYLTSKTSIIYADPDFGPASQRMMAAIISAMINKDRVAVVRVVHKAKGSPVLYVFFPHKDPEQGFYCFHGCQLPWRLDAREVALPAFVLPSDGAKGPKVPSKEMLEGARAFVTRGSLLTSEFSAGVKKENENEAAPAVSVAFRHNPSGVANPAIQRFYQAVAHKLLDPLGMPSFEDTPQAAPAFEPSDDIFNAASETGIETLFNIKWANKDKETTVGKKRAREDEQDGEEGESKRAAVKQEDTGEEQDLVIPDFAASSAKPLDTSRPVETLEKLWAAEPLEAGHPERHAKAMIKVEEVTIALVENSPGERDYPKALELIERARVLCGEASSIQEALFNTLFNKLAERWQKGDRDAFWDTLIDGGVRRFKVEGEETQEAGGDGGGESPMAAADDEFDDAE